MRWNSFWKLKVVKTCKLNFENQTFLVDFWEWSSKQLTCNLIFEFFFWIFGSGEQFVSPANWIRKSKLPYVALGMDLWSVNLQTEFQKIFLDIWKWWTVCNTSKLNFDKQNWLMDFLGIDPWTANLKGDFQKFFLDFWKYLPVFNTCKLNFENRNRSMEFWEWDS